MELRAAMLQRKLMRKRLFGFALSTMLFALCSTAEAQQTKIVPESGTYRAISIRPIPARSRLVTSRLSAKVCGSQGTSRKRILSLNPVHRIGRNQRLPALAEELIILKVEVIVADSIASARAAKKATSTIPIVMASVGDPIVAGLVNSLARPGGNITGTTDYNAELLGKHQELLKEIVPKVSRFAFLIDVSSAVSKPMFKDGQAAAQALGVNLQLMEVKFPDPDLEGAFRAMAKQRIGALITGSGNLGSSLHRKKILALVEQARMPAIYTTEPSIRQVVCMYY